MTAGEVLFWIFAAAACLGAIAVVITQNVVRMAFWLVVSLGSTAGLFFMLHADFVGATQFLIYVGGTVVLLIFGVMLTATGPLLQHKGTGAEVMMGAGVGAVFLVMIISTVIAVEWDQLATSRSESGTLASVEPGFNIAERGNTLRPLGMSLLGVRPDKDLGRDDDEALSTGYLLPFEIVSIHLLVVLIGAGYLARAKRRVRPQSDTAATRT